MAKVIIFLKQINKPYNTVLMTIVVTIYEINIMYGIMRWNENPVVSKSQDFTVSADNNDFY
jgi:hypothetical protein